MKNAKIKTLGNVFVLALALAGGVGVVGALIAIKNISTVQDTWDTFELGRPEKLRILGALRKEIGYGGMIHQFKNYVLRQDAARIGAINSKLSGVSAAISRYRALDLDGAESAALADIEKVIGEYSRNLLTASNLVKRGRPPRDIDRLVKIDDLPALEGLRVLENQARRRPQTGTAVTSKIQIVASVRKSLGYGGMIHQFKNYILRQDQDGIDAVGEHLDAARLALAQYLQHPLSSAETQAVAHISDVIAAYSKALGTATQLIGQGMLPAQIDRAVVVDDGPALRGLDALTREIVARSEVEAGNVQSALATAAWVSGTAAWILAIFIVFLVAATIWLFRSQIVEPISRLTGIMSDLAAGKLDLPIETTETNHEIAEMARAVAVFKANAEALQQVREELEQRVQERTRELQNSEQRFRDFASAASDWYWEIDAERRYTYMSSAVSALGRTPDLYQSP